MDTVLAEGRSVTTTIMRGLDNKEDIKMIVKVMHKEDKDIEPVVYENVEEVVDCFNDNGVYCHQLIMKDGSTATYPACEWAFWKRCWSRMF